MPDGQRVSVANLDNVEELLESVRALLARRKVNVGAQFGLSVTSSPAVKLTVPSGATSATISVRTATVVFKRDGSLATATAGTPANDGDIINLGSGDALRKFSVIAVSASATLDVEYFRDEAA